MEVYSTFRNTTIRNALQNALQRFLKKQINQQQLEVRRKKNHKSK